jgi:hypothetical protein
MKYNFVRLSAEGLSINFDNAGRYLSGNSFSDRLWLPHYFDVRILQRLYRFGKNIEAPGIFLCGGACSNYACRAGGLPRFD